MDYQTALDKTVKILEESPLGDYLKSPSFQKIHKTGAEDLAKEIIDALGFQENNDELFRSLVEKICKEKNMSLVEAVKLLRTETRSSLKESHNAIAHIYGRNLLV
jgi:flagellar biosynthesis protein FliP